MIITAYVDYDSCVWTWTQWYFKTHKINCVMRETTYTVRPKMIYTWYILIYIFEVLVLLLQITIYTGGIVLCLFKMRTSKTYI